MQRQLAIHLVVGTPPRPILERFASSCSRFCNNLEEIQEHAAPVAGVLAEASFDYFDYLRFGQEMVKLRDQVVVGGDLILARWAGTKDSYFVYRDDDCFRSELPAAFEADFEHVAVGEEAGALFIHAQNRRPPLAADEYRARLPWQHIAHLFTFASTALPLPKYAWVPATFRCNLRCRTCSVRNSPPGQDITDELIDQIFSAVGDSLEVVNVTGVGEPLFARTWPHLRQRIRERPYRRMEIVTNGMLLTEEEVRDMMQADHPTILVVSIDGATKETFEFIRDRAKWERLVATMEMIARLRRELQPGPLFSLGVDFVAVKDNIAELPHLIPKLAEWGVDLVIVIEMGDWEVNHDFYYAQALRFYPRLANEFYDKARAVAARYPFRLVSIPPNYTEEAIAKIERQNCCMPQPAWRRAARRIYHSLRSHSWGKTLCQSILRAIECYCEHPWGSSRNLAQWLRQQVAISRIDGFGEFRRVQGFCEVIAERAYFHIDGQLAICCGLMQPKLGDLRKTDFRDIWNSAEWREFRLRNLFGFPHSACYFCTLPYGLPEKNPENFMASHRLGERENWLAHALRRWRCDLG
ncbi:MAG: radical SAM/SPASM domain-containing protein [Candidatus Sumerlaeaceae bacterium]|jgi:MoaA/NifB/PqqE/SkfB family radical SAM enzyme